LAFLVGFWFVVPAGLPETLLEGFIDDVPIRSCSMKDGAEVTSRKFAASQDNTRT